MGRFSAWIAAHAARILCLGIFAALLMPGVTVDRSRALLPEDTRVLQDNYIHHWGMLFVAGQQLQPAGTSFDIAVAGDYRLEAAVPLVIDDDRVTPGSTIALAVGAHSVEFGGGAGAATLHWAQASSVPALPPTDPLTFFDRNSWAGMTPSTMRPDAAR